MIKKQNIAILGSTGSIGTQTLDVVRSYPELFEVEMLTAHSNYELLARQAVEFQPSTVIITDARYYDKLKTLLQDQPVKVYSGAGAVEQEVRNENIDTVVTAVTGFSGLLPTVAAIESGKKIALANKETLVVAGDLIIPMAQRFGAPIIPVDSEHSAIFQSLVGERSPIRRVVITASGGALRDMDLDRMHCATVDQVLNHPNWSMGAKITVDSATMLNKGFEVIEAAHLFGLSQSQIDVVVHPESIIHSMVEFEDGAFKAQLGTPDMRLPIQYALTFPERMAIKGSQYYNPLGNLTFKEVDPQRYPCLDLAYRAMSGGGVMPTVLNAAGEIAVSKFLKQEINYAQIPTLIEKALNIINNQPIESIEQIVEIDKQTRKL
ncbi:MAG: 1-deoxy-D-xylulose-5-phosphate reductoisomerase [Rikenellaceae bacterium]